MATSLSKTAALPARSRSASADRWRERMPAILAAVGAVVFWQLVITVFQVPQFIAPSPLDVVMVFANDGMLLLRNFWPTLFEALLGFFFGNLTAILLAVWFVHNQTAERAFYPLAVFFHTIPIIAIAARPSIATAVS